MQAACTPPRESSALFVLATLPSMSGAKAESYCIVRIGRSVVFFVGFQWIYLLGYLIRSTCLIFVIQCLGSLRNSRPGLGSGGGGNVIFSSRWEKETWGRVGGGVCGRKLVRIILFRRFPCCSFQIDCLGTCMVAQSLRNFRITF